MLVGAASGNEVQAMAGTRYLSSATGSGAGADTTPTLGSEDAIVVTQLHIQK